jgi:hypothetical protein
LNMKKKLTIIMAGLSACLFLGLAPLAAAVGEADSQLTTTAETPATDKKEQLKARLETKKSELKIKLDENQKQRYKARCSAAQGTVKSLSENINGRVVVRQKAYTKLVEKLESLSFKLDAKAIDVVELNAQIETLKLKIAGFDTDLEAYKLSIADLKDVDCVTDPDAFKAALDASRLARDKLIATSKDIKSYVNDTVKVTIKTLREQLAAQKEANSSTTNESEGTN